MVAGKIVIEAREQLWGEKNCRSGSFSTQTKNAVCGSLQNQSLGAIDFVGTSLCRGKV